MTTYHSYDEGQILFERNVSGLMIAARILLKILIYFPLLCTGYAICTTFLKRSDNAIWWLGLSH